MSRCTKVTWYTLQHYKYERYISFIHSLQRTNLVLFNGFLSLFKYIYQPLNSYSTDPPPFLAWLTGHIRLRNLSTFASFRWVRCDHSKVGGASNLVNWFGCPLLLDSGIMSSTWTQVPTYFPHLLWICLEFSPRSICTTHHPSCTTPHHRISTVASHPNLLHTIFLCVF